MGRNKGREGGRWLHEVRAVNGIWRLPDGCRFTDDEAGEKGTLSDGTQQQVLLRYRSSVDQAPQSPAGLSLRTPK